MKKHLEILSFEEAGIWVTVAIDYDRGKISLVEKENDRTYKPKKWLFSERELQFMGGWRKILTSMDHAIFEAQKLLEEDGDKRFEEKAKLIDKLESDRVDVYEYRGKIKVEKDK
jgi:hypothetical protein